MLLFLVQYQGSDMYTKLKDATRLLGAEYKIYYPDLEKALSSKHTLCIGSRQIGKTRFISIEAQRYAAENPNSRIFIHPLRGYQGEMIFKRDLMNVNYICSVKKKNQNVIFKCWNGSIIEIGNINNQRNLLSYDYLIFDEIGFDFEVNRVLNNIFHMLKMNDTKILIMGTPNSSLPSDKNFMLDASCNGDFTVIFVNPVIYPGIISEYPYLRFGERINTYRNEYLGKF